MEESITILEFQRKFKAAEDGIFAALSRAINRFEL